MSIQQPQLQQAPSFSVFQDRAIYKVADNVFNPVSLSALDGIMSKGTASQRVRRSADSLGGWLAFDGVVKLYHKGLNKLYQSNPKLADSVNQHPLLYGIPITLLGTTLGSLAKHHTEKLIEPITKRLLEPVLDKGFQTSAGKSLRNAFGFLNKGVVQKSLMVGVVGVGVLTLLRAVQDTFDFGKRYNASRSVLKSVSPDVSIDPYGLKQLTLASREIEKQGFQAPSPVRETASIQA